MRDQPVPCIFVPFLLGLISGTNANNSFGRAPELLQWNDQKWLFHLYRNLFYLRKSTNNEEPLGVVIKAWTVRVHEALLASTLALPLQSTSFSTLLKKFPSAHALSTSTDKDEWPSKFEQTLKMLLSNPPCWIRMILHVPHWSTQCSSHGQGNVPATLPPYSLPSLLHRDSWQLQQ